MPRSLDPKPLRARTLLALLLGAALAGCAGGPLVRVEPLTQVVYPPSQLVEVLQAPPQRPYVALARLRGEAPAGTAGVQVVAALQQKAAALGADAIIVRDESRQVPARFQYNPAGGQYQSTPPEVIPIYSALAIRWLPPKAAERTGD